MNVRESSHPLGQRRCNRAAEFALQINNELRLAYLLKKNALMYNFVVAA
jgi:hypothetical protein